MRLDPKQKAALDRWHPTESWPHRFYAKAVTYSCILLMRGLNRTEIEGLEGFQRCLHQRESGRGLLTFSNHVSLLDDPMVTANFKPPNYRKLRWIAADAVNFWGGPIRARLSTAGKCVPIARGGGGDQVGFRFITERLRAGDWVHIFPEGGRTRDPNALLRTPFKNGIGHLIAEARPVVIPYYHYGLQDILPIGTRLPRIGQRVRVKIGTPVDCNEEFFRGLDSKAGAGGVQLYRAIAQWSYEQLRALELELNPHASEPARIPSAS